MLKRLFIAHPRSVGETYGEHFRTAGGVGVTMIAGGLACLAHAVVPSLFVTTGSRTIARLSRRLVKTRADAAEARSGWVI